LEIGFAHCKSLLRSCFLLSANQTIRVHALAIPDTGHLRISPQWMNIPNFASRHHCIRASGGAAVRKQVAPPPLRQDEIVLFR